MNGKHLKFIDPCRNEGVTWFTIKGTTIRVEVYSDSITLPEANSSHLKMDGWKMKTSFWDGLFAGVLWFVLGSLPSFCCFAHSCYWTSAEDAHILENLVFQMHPGQVNRGQTADSVWGAFQNFYSNLFLQSSKQARNSFRVGCKVLWLRLWQGSEDVFLPSLLLWFFVLLNIHSYFIHDHSRIAACAIASGIFRLHVYKVNEILMSSFGVKRA